MAAILTGPHGRISPNPNRRRGAIDTTELAACASNLMHFAAGPAFYYQRGLAVPAKVKKLSYLAINKRRKAWTPILKEIKEAARAKAPVAADHERRGPSPSQPWRRKRPGLSKISAYKTKIGKTGLWARVQLGQVVGRPPTGDDMLYRTAQYGWAPFYQGGQIKDYNWKAEPEWVRREADKRKFRILSSLGRQEVEFIRKLLELGVQPAFASGLKEVPVGSTITRKGQLPGQMVMRL